MTHRKTIQPNAERTPPPVAYLGNMPIDAEQATRLINACGRDAGNRSMAAAGRTSWSRADYNAACRESTRLFRAVGLAP